MFYHPSDFWDQDDDRIPENNDEDLGLQLTAREPALSTMKLSDCLNEVPPTPRLKKPGRVSPDAPRKTPDSRPPKSPVVFEARPPSRCPPPNFGDEPKKSMLGDLPALDKKKKRRKKKKKASKKELDACMSLELEVPLQQLHAKNAAAAAALVQDRHSVESHLRATSQSACRSSRSHLTPKHRSRTANLLSSQIESRRRSGTPSPSHFGTRQYPTPSLVAHSGDALRLTPGRRPTAYDDLRLGLSPRPVPVITQMRVTCTGMWE